MSTPLAAAAGLIGLALLNRQPRRLTLAEIQDLARATVETYRFNYDWRIAMRVAWIESSSRRLLPTFDPVALRIEPDGRRSVGIMQTLVGTARENWDRGYRAFAKPTATSLQQPAVSMYNGCAYLHRASVFQNARRSEEFMARAYNGGLGFAQQSNGFTRTEAYWLTYLRAKARLG